MVDYDPWSGDFTGTIIRDNLILGGFATDAIDNDNNSKGNNFENAIIKQVPKQYSVPFSILSPSSELASQLDLKLGLVTSMAITLSKVVPSQATSCLALSPMALPLLPLQVSLSKETR